MLLNAARTPKAHYIYAKKLEPVIIGGKKQCLSQLTSNNINWNSSAQLTILWYHRQTSSSFIFAAEFKVGQ